MYLQRLLAPLLLTRAASLTLQSGCGGTSMGFPEYIEKYGRSYEAGTEEYSRRQAVFEQRVARIAGHNCDPVGPWTAAVNHLTDWTAAELATLRGHRSARRQGGGVASRMPFFLEKRRRHRKHGSGFPKDFSWGTLSAITANSSDQGTCGSCWAHAARVTMQARAEIKGLTNIEWSTNQLTSCTPNPRHCGGEGGCDGATAELAYEYVLNAGLLLDREYREKAGGDQHAKCPADLEAKSDVATDAILSADGAEMHRVGKNRKHLVGAKLGLKGWTKLPENKEEPLVRELYENGPVYVAVAAGNHWFDYSGGVMTEDGCDRDQIVNHAVVLFAWGVKKTTVRGPIQYWQIKNSWGPNWGEHGTGRVIRSDTEETRCGWDEDPQSGSACDGGPERVWVCGTCGILYDAVAPHF